MILKICDSNMMNRAVDSRYPGSTHDGFVWNLCSARQHLLRQYENGDRTSKMLGNGGYGIEPFLLKPSRDPQYGTFFSSQHSRKNNWRFEMSIPLFAGNFALSPAKGCQILNVCCALHNICRHWDLRVHWYKQFCHIN